VSARFPSRARLVLALALIAGTDVGFERAARADDNACIAATEASINLHKSGKLRDAVKALAACADPSCPDEVKAECALRLQETRRAIPTLSLALQDQAGHDIGTATIKIDGTPIPGAQDGRAIDLDPGEHHVVVEAPGFVLLDRSFVAHVGEKGRHEMLVLVPPPKPKQPSWWTAQRKLAATSVGLGVVGLAIGGVFAGFAASDKSRESGDCSAQACRNYPQAVADYNAASSNGTGSTVGFVVGGVFAAAGVVLFATAPKPRPLAPASTGAVLRVAPMVFGSGGGGGMSMGGSF
jgi:hypothetical protein